MNNLKYMFSVFLLVTLTSAQVKIDTRQNNERIAGGQPTTEGEFPFLVSLTYNGEHICGGFIFNQRFVVTAASCVAGLLYTDVTVVVGQYSLIFPDPYEKRYQLVAITPYETYDPELGLHNIALLETSQSMILTAGHVEVGYYNEANSSFPESTVMGWGATQEEGLASIDLRKADIEVLTDDGCSTYGGGEFDPNYMVCAGSETASPCNFDQGSPLLQHGYVVGIVSGNKGCAMPFVPTIFTRLTSYYAWLLRNAGQQPPPLTTTTTASPEVPL